MTMLRKTFLSLVAAIGLFAMSAAAQITSPITADIPFPFTVADTQLPAGNYTIRSLDSELTAMEISSADGKTHAEFLVGDADLASPAAKTELEFHKYGNREFLAQIFEQGTMVSSQVVKGHAELRLIKSKAKRTVHRHPARKK